MQIILGSASPWRKKILQAAGYTFTSMAANIDEQAIRHKDPKQLVQLLAQAKAQALLARIPKDPASLLITSDQVVLCNNEIREKPVDAKQAQAYLQSYPKHPATTITAVTITNTQTLEQLTQVDLATVFFKTIPEETINKLISQGEIFNCAGVFQVEGDHDISPYVTKIDGDIDSVKGLPMVLVKTMLSTITTNNE